MTELEDLAKRICDVLDDGGNLLAGSAMHSMLKEALANARTPESQGWSAADADSNRAPYEIPR